MNESDGDKTPATPDVVLKHELLKAMEILATISGKSHNNDNSEESMTLRSRVAALEAELKTERKTLAEIASRLQAEVLNVDQLRVALDEVNDEKDALSRLSKASDDKIAVLRNTSKALENENQLLIADRENLGKEIAILKENVDDLRAELKAKNAERNEFHERFRRLENEKINVLRQNLALEGELEASRRHQEHSMNRGNEALEQRLAEVTSLYESMQKEVSLTMEQMDTRKEEEMAGVKERYIKLFHEKTEELHECQEALKKAKSKITDMELREAEMQTLLGRSQAATEAQLTEVRQRSEALEADLTETRQRYEELQESYKSSVEVLGKRLYDISDLLKAYQMKEKPKENKVEEEVKEMPTAVMMSKSAKKRQRKKKNKNSAVQ